MDRDEVFRTREPDSDIQCRNCKFRLNTIEVRGEKVERYKFAHAMLSRINRMKFSGKVASVSFTSLNNIH